MTQAQPEYDPGAINTATRYLVESVTVSLADELASIIAARKNEQP